MVFNSQQHWRDLCTRANGASDKMIGRMADDVHAATNAGQRRRLQGELATLLTLPGYTAAMRPAPLTCPR